MVSVTEARVSPEIEFKALPYFSGLAHTCQLLFENGDFFLWFSLPSILVWSKRSPKTHLFKNVFQSGDFWKPLFAALVWMDEISRLRHGGSDTILRCAYSHQRWYRLQSHDRQNDSTKTDTLICVDSASVCFKFLIPGSTYWMLISFLKNDY